MKSDTKKSAKKQLEISITDKFLQALHELGHDAQKLKREVKKVSKFMAKKINRKIKDVKTIVEKKFETKPVKKAIKKAEGSTTTAKKDIAKKVEKVGKVIAKATKAAEKKTEKVAVAKTDKVVPADMVHTELPTAVKRGRKPIEDKNVKVNVKPVKASAKNKTLNKD